MAENKIVQIVILLAIVGLLLWLLYVGSFGWAAVVVYLLYALYQLKCGRFPFPF